MRSAWIRGSVLQTISAVVRLAFGLLFAWILLDTFGIGNSGAFWATAVAYQIAFTLCGFGLPYGIAHQQGRHYAFQNPEVRASLAFILMTMVVLLVAVWLFLDRNLLGASVGLHFLVNRLVFMVIFFRRNALEFNYALYQQLAYDSSVIAVLIAAWGTGARFESFAAALVALNAFWLMLIIWTARLGSQSTTQAAVALRHAFAGWGAFSARTYSTEIVGLVLNGLDRVVLAALGQEDFLAIYVLARKFYEVPHNIMAAQSTFVFAIMVKLSTHGSANPDGAPDGHLARKCAQMTRTRLAIVLSYEGLAIFGYGLLSVLLFQFRLIDRAGDIGVFARDLVAFFLIVGVAQASLIPMLNLTYAQGKAHLILYFTLANAAVGSALLLAAWMQGSTFLVLLSQSVIVLTSWSFMTGFLLREFGFRLGGAIALGKLTLLIVLNVWLFQVSAIAIPILKF